MLAWPLSMVIGALLRTDTARTELEQRGKATSIVLHCCCGRVCSAATVFILFALQVVFAFIELVVLTWICECLCSAWIFCFGNVAFDAVLCVVFV